MSSLNPTEKAKCLQDLRKPLVTVKCNAEIHTSFARAQHYPQWVKALCPEIMISEIFWDLHCQAKMRVGLLHNLSYHMSAKCQAITVHYSVGYGVHKHGLSLNQNSKLHYYLAQQQLHLNRTWRKLNRSLNTHQFQYSHWPQALQNLDSN